VGRLHYDIVKLLMENGANVNLRHSEANYSDPPSSSNSGQKSDEVKQYPSPLEIAISIGDKRMVQVYFKIVFLTVTLVISNTTTNKNKNIKQLKE
jgi:ankyrin repeat protein